MKLRKRFWGALGGLAVVSGAALASEPKELRLDEPRQAAKPAASNQRTAEQIAAAISEMVTERGYAVDIDFRGSVATLTGTALSTSQMVQILAAAERTPDVEQVVNRLSIRKSSSIQVTGLQQPNGEQLPRPIPSGERTIDGGPGGAMIGGSAGVRVQQTLTPAAPQHVFTGSAGVQVDSAFLPPFAWPSHAPYPNYSAVQYPTCYPASAWPHIGPFHPYPEPPLDWRKVTLKWDDGHWYLRFRHHHLHHPFYH